jgi:hypothetical protein
VRIAVIAVALLCSACLSFPALAAAARIELRPGQATGTTEFAYTAGPGEVNNPLLQHHMSWYYLQDAQGPVTERVPPCEPNPDPGGLGVSSRCPAASVARAVVDLGDRDDLGDVDQNTLLFIPVTVLGGPGGDRISMHSFEGNLLDGGPGDDVITSEVLSPTLMSGPGDTVVGGDGNDQIGTRNDRRDFVHCGSGSDVVTADDLDDVAADCETVNLPPGSPWVRVDGRPVGVTINNGAVFTKTPHVRLTVLAPDAATHVRISNDGGFSNSVTVPRRKNEKYRFDLASSGPERLPKTVYVRFEGPGLDPSRTFTDDIILDEKRPNLGFARVLGHTGAGVRIALRARDATSGVRTAQFALARSRPWASVRYRSRITVRRKPRWARVRDGARNAARWRRVAQ